MPKKWSDKYKKSINCDNPKGFRRELIVRARKKLRRKRILVFLEKRGNLLTQRNILIFILTKIQRELSMDSVLKMLQPLKHLFLKFAIHQDLMLTKSRQQLLWNKEQEKWVNLRKQQFIESTSTR